MVPDWIQPVEANFVIHPKTDFILAVQATDLEGNAIDFTTATLVGQARESVDSSSTAYNFAIDKTDAAAGKIVIRMTKAVTAQLQSLDTLVYDVLAVWPPGTTIKLLFGKLSVIQTVVSIA